MYDQAVEGSWRWVQDCTRFDPWQALNWAPGEPNDLVGYQDCGILNRFGQWNDTVCDAAYPYVCEVMVKSKYYGGSSNFIQKKMWVI